MTTVSARDAAALLVLVHDGAEARGTELFPSLVLEGMARLIPSDALVGYQEVDVSRGCRLVERIEVTGRPVPAAVAAASKWRSHQDPLKDPLWARETRVLMLSDFVSSRRLRGLQFYADVWRPLGIEHRIRVWLPAPPGRARAVFLERSGRPYEERDRTLLELLRPHLAQFERSAAFRRSAKETLGLTDREAEILGWVGHGKTNAEIALILHLSPHTVRSHLENVFDKLGVHTRTAAARRFASATSYAS